MSRFVFSLVFAGCGSEERIDYCVEAEGALPEDAETLRIDVTLSMTPEGPFCEPAALTVSPDLPYCFSVVPGDRYDSWTVVRARLLAGREVVARRDVASPFAEDGTLERVVRMDPSCACDDTEQCVDGTCVPVPWPGLFEEPDGLVASGDACTTREL